MEMGFSLKHVQKAINATGKYKYANITTSIMFANILYMQLNDFE
jgi:hypothetical protein